MKQLPSENEIAEFFSLLSVETRIKIMRLLSEKPLCVNALAQQLGLSQSAISQHLRVLRNVNLVGGEKRGYFVHYRLTFQNLQAWQKEVLKILEINPPSKDADSSTMCCKGKMEKGKDECNH
jgi:ArsR family transcriptional regulator, arsenate/arsenite/antimonite-responsive transcriptional repressor